MFYFFLSAVIKIKHLFDAHEKNGSFFQTPHAIHQLTRFRTSTKKVLFCTREPSDTSASVKLFSQFLCMKDIIGAY